MRDLLDAMTAIGAAVFTMGEGDGAPKFETTDPAQRQAVAEPTSLNLAVQILLKDYIERAKQEKRESDVISGR